MTEIVPGIHQLKLPLPRPDVFLGYVNIYLVRGESGYLLVDTGWSTEEAFVALEEQLAEIGTKVGEISQIVVTHIHPDHSGLVGRLKQLCHAKFYLHHLEKDLIQPRYINMEPLLEQTNRWLQTNGVPEAELPSLQKASVEMARRFVTVALPDVTLSGDETIPTGFFTFKVLWSPGHSPGQICLYEPEKKLLFSGDHILPTITPNIGLHPQSSANPLGDFIKSLNEIKQLDIDLVLPGHENPFTGLSTRIDALIQHHEQRKSNIVKALKDGAKTTYQIANRILWMTDEYGEEGISYQSLAPLDKRLAVLETLAHLELLRIDGKIDKSSRNSIIYYHRI